MPKTAYLPTKPRLKDGGDPRAEEPVLEVREEQPGPARNQILDSETFKPMMGSKYVLTVGYPGSFSKDTGFFLYTRRVDNTRGVPGALREATEDWRTRSCGFSLIVSIWKRVSQPSGKTTWVELARRRIVGTEER